MIVFRVVSISQNLIHLLVELVNVIAHAGEMCWYLFSDKVSGHECGKLPAIPDQTSGREVEIHPAVYQLPFVGMCRSKPEATKRIPGKKQYINPARLCLYSCSSFCY
jgi:hypothetical protein